MTANFSDKIKRASTFLLSLGFALAAAGPVHAIGTDAGLNIQNTATVNFEIGGAAQTPVDSNTVVTLVDELIDVVVVDDNGGSVSVSTPDSGVFCSSL